jgi:DNA modification methylase
MGKLADTFLIPPFSIFNSANGYWQKRKKYWENLKVNDIASREHVTIHRKAKENDYIDEVKGQTSSFDPVLAEIIIRWFTNEKFKVLDPFAGGCRGLITSKLNRKYVGIELRQEQIEANEKQANEILKENQPIYIYGDSNEIENLIPENLKFDFLFSCPPYGSLEKYSDNPKDLSTMSNENFDITYKSIINKCCKYLKEDRFACFVVGDYRLKNGAYSCFPAKTINDFTENGLHFYNDIVLLNSIGNVRFFAANNLNKTRKITKIHQNVLVFYKGNLKNIGENFKELMFEKNKSVM